MCLFAFSARFFGVSAAWDAMPAGGAPPALHFVQRTSWEGRAGEVGRRIGDCGGRLGRYGYGS